MHQRFVYPLAFVAAIVAIFFLFSKQPTKEESVTTITSSPSVAQSAPTQADVDLYTEKAKDHIVRITTAKGVMDLELYPQDAPLHVTNFMKLTEAGFYDGLIFHRVVPDFVIQGGDPDGNGTGGPGYNVKAEFNSRKHLTGTLAMARSMDPDSAGSQFYITLAPQPNLDGDYTVFGQLLSDQGVVEKIAMGDVMESVKVLSKTEAGY